MRTHRIVFAGVGALLVAIPLISFAAIFKGGEMQSVGQGEVITDDVYMVGSTLSHSGQVVGDLYAGGGDILISGGVSQDLVAGGGTVNFTGTVGDDLRIGGGTVILNGEVADDAMIGGGKVTLTGRRIGGDAIIGGGIIHIATPVEGKLSVRGGEVQINGPVRGNVEIFADSVTLGPNAAIQGNLTYRSPNMLKADSNAKVFGETTYTKARGGAENRAHILAAFWSFVAIVKLLMLLVGSFAFFYAFRRYTEKMVHHTHARPLREMGIGLLTIIVLPVASIILLVTIVGIPLGILGFLTFFATLIFGCLMAPIVLGALLLGKTKEGQWKKITWKTILIGVAAFWFLGFIPLVGPLAHFVLFLLTIGAAASVKMAIAKEWR